MLQQINYTHDHHRLGQLAAKNILTRFQAAYSKAGLLKQHRALETGEVSYPTNGHINEKRQANYTGWEL